MEYKLLLTIRYSKIRVKELRVFCADKQKEVQYIKKKLIVYLDITELTSFSSNEYTFVDEEPESRLRFFAKGNQTMSEKFSDTELEQLNKTLPVYEAALQAILLKINNLNTELINVQNNYRFEQINIEHIKGRLKSVQSIAAKLQRLNLPITAENAKNHVKDISGIRIICPFSKDIYTLADILTSIQDWKVMEQKDYISEPKPSGYRSLHIIIQTHVNQFGITEAIPAEIQIRTAAMDFWASIEHQVRYKYREQVPAYLSDELVICAEKIAELDKRMLLINEVISLINQDVLFNQ